MKSRALPTDPLMARAMSKARETLLGFLAIAEHPTAPRCREPLRRGLRDRSLGIIHDGDAAAPLHRPGSASLHRYLLRGAGEESRHAIQRDPQLELACRAVPSAVGAVSEDVALENVLYVVHGKDFYGVGVVRAVLQLPFHVAVGIIMGCCVALAWKQEARRPFWTVTALTHRARRAATAARC